MHCCFFIVSLCLPKNKRKTSMRRQILCRVQAATSKDVYEKEQRICKIWLIEESHSATVLLFFKGQTQVFLTITTVMRWGRWPHFFFFFLIKCRDINCTKLQFYLVLLNLSTPMSKQVKWMQQESHLTQKDHNEWLP